MALMPSVMHSMAPAAEWTMVYTDTVRGNADMVFDAKQSLLNLIQEQEIKQYDLGGHLVATIPVTNGERLAHNSGHSLMDTVNNQIISYSLSDLQLARFSFNEQQWSRHPEKQKDQMHFNHARAFNTADSSFYFFGGAGHTKYHNDLFRIEPHTGLIEQFAYNNAIPPRFGAAMGFADGKLYIAGGKGNSPGKQALEAQNYYDMWEVDLSTHQVHKLWELPAHEGHPGWLLSSTMCYNPEEDAFYAVNMDDRGGTLMRISRTEPKAVAVSSPIHNNAAYKDFDYSLLYSKRLGQYIFIVDKTGINKEHTICAYTIPSSELSPDASASESASHASLWITLGCAAALLLIILLLLFRRRRNRND